MSAHPLDPLSAEEIAAAAAILRRDQGVGERWRFASIELREPSKAVVRDFAPGDPIAPRGRGDLLEPRRRRAPTRRSSRSTEDRVVALGAPARASSRT